MLSKDITPLFVGFRFIDFIGWTFPPGLPIFFNVVYSWSLLKLLYLGVMGTEPKKTVTSAELSTMFFDKTGTLTETKVEVNTVYEF